MVMQDLSPIKSNCFGIGAGHPLNPKIMIDYLFIQYIFYHGTRTSIYEWLFQLDDSTPLLGKFCVFTLHPLNTGCLRFRDFRGTMVTMSIQSGMTILLSFATCERLWEVSFLTQGDGCYPLTCNVRKLRSQDIIGFFRVMLGQKVSFIPTIWPKFSTTLDLWKN